MLNVNYLNYFAHVFVVLLNMIICSWLLVYVKLTLSNYKQIYQGSPTGGCGGHVKNVKKQLFPKWRSKKLATFSKTKNFTYNNFRSLDRDNANKLHQIHTKH